MDGISRLETGLIIIEGETTTLPVFLLLESGHTLISEDIADHGIALES